MILYFLKVVDISNNRQLAEYQMPNDQKSLNDQKMYAKHLGQLVFLLKNIIQFYFNFNFNMYKVFLIKHIFMINRLSLNLFFLLLFSSIFFSYPFFSSFFFSFLFFFFSSIFSVLFTYIFFFSLLFSTLLLSNPFFFCSLISYQSPLCFLFVVDI